LRIYQKTRTSRLKRGLGGNNWGYRTPESADVGQEKGLGGGDLAARRMLGGGEEWGQLSNRGGDQRTQQEKFGSEGVEEGEKGPGERNRVSGSTAIYGTKAVEGKESELKEGEGKGGSHVDHDTSTCAGKGEAFPLKGEAWGDDRRRSGEESLLLWSSFRGDGTETLCLSDGREWGHCSMKA